MNRVEVLEKLNPMVEGEIRNVKSSDGARVIVEDGTVGLRTHRGARLIDMGPEGVKSVTHFVGLPLHLARELTHATFSQALSELLGRPGISSYGQQGYQRAWRADSRHPSVFEHIQALSCTRTSAFPSEG
jgi:hypothetical protein